jgi:tetratricopeptide (TPR) repeat protein
MIAVRTFASYKEDLMAKTTFLILLTVLLAAFLAGCGAPAVKRAPIDTIPADADVEVKIEMLEEMGHAYPGDALVYYELGNLYSEQLLAVDAMESYERALGIDPSLNMARVNLAMLLAESDEVDSAKVLLEEAIRIDPTDAKALNNLGMVYYTELDNNTAVKYFLKALEVDPGNIEAHYNLGLAFAERGLLHEAVREWNAILESGDEGETAQRARLSVERVEKELKQE